MRFDHILAWWFGGGVLGVGFLFGFYPVGLFWIGLVGFLVGLQKGVRTITKQSPGCIFPMGRLVWDSAGSVCVCFGSVFVDFLGVGGIHGGRSAG